MNSYTVSTECPSCAAPLDFSEGSNAVECRHCRSKLMVTGRKQVLSYYIKPKFDHYRAIASAMKAQQELNRDCRVIKPQIHFIPYYRLIGSDFRWEEAPRMPAKPDLEYGESDCCGSAYGWEREDAGIGFDTMIKHAGNVIDMIFGSNHSRTGIILNAGDKDIAPLIHTGSDKEEVGPAKAQIADRYVEKNFIACNLHGEGLYSLGLRPAVLRLELFQQGAIEQLGRIVTPDLGIDEAMGCGMKDAAMQPLLFRSVLGRILSIIYFPFWTIEVECENKRMLSIVDAVSQTVVKSDADPSMFAALDKHTQAEPKILGFRPLSCPNCGWDLPLRPDDAIFFCSSCARAWQIYGSELSEVSYKIAQIDNLAGQTKYLPFWVIGAISGAEKLTFYVPAFRFRRLKMLADLSANITRKKPQYSIREDERQDLKEMQGCYYDSEDALLLAQFVHAGTKSQIADDMRAFDRNNLEVQSSTLTWFPFEVNGCNLVDPFSGTSIPQSLLI